MVLHQRDQRVHHTGNRHGSDLGVAAGFPDRNDDLPHHGSGRRRTDGLGLGDGHRHRAASIAGSSRSRCVQRSLRWQARAVGRPKLFHRLISPGRFKETEGSDEYPGSYTYGNTGSNTGTVTLNYDDGDRCTFRLTFASATSGTANFSCNDGTSGSSSWRLGDIPPDDDDGDTSQTCAKGSIIKPGGSCDLKDANGMKIGTFSVPITVPDVCV